MRAPIILIVSAALAASGCVGLGEGSDEAQGGPDGDGGDGTSAPAGNATTVVMHASAFSPALLEVAAGTDVYFRNADTQNHAPYNESGRFAIGNVPPGGVVAVSFTEVGEFAYRCQHHPSSMSGVVRVVAAEP